MRVLVEGLEDVGAEFSPGLVKGRGGLVDGMEGVVGRRSLLRL